MRTKVNTWGGARLWNAHVVQIEEAVSRKSQSRRIAGKAVATSNGGILAQRGPFLPQRGREEGAYHQES